MADTVADHAKVDSEVAVATAREFAPDFKPSVLDRFDRIRDRERFRPMNVDTTNALSTVNMLPIKPKTNHFLPAAPLINKDPNRLLQLESPVKQTQFLHQTAIRRLSMMQKQDSFNYTSTPNQQPAPVTNSEMIKSLHFDSMTPNIQQKSNQYQSAARDSMDPYRQATGNYRGNDILTHNLNNMGLTEYQLNENEHHLRTEYEQNTGKYLNNTTGIASSQKNNNLLGSKLADPSIQQLNVTHHQPTVYSQQLPSHGIHADEQHTNYINNQSDTPRHNHFNTQLPANMQGIDHFDHYKRVPSRESSTDRYTRAASRLGGGSGSRQQSIDRQIAINNVTSTPTKEQTPDKRLRSDSMTRPVGSVGICASTSGTIKRSSITMTHHAASPSHAIYSSPNQPFEDVLLRQRTLGQDIIPSPREPKRTESLYLPPKPLIGNGGVNNGGSGGGGKLLKVC